MLDYLPELLKGLHTSLTLTAASIVVALIPGADLYHRADVKNAGGGVDRPRLYHPVYRDTAAGADLP